METRRRALTRVQHVLGELLAFRDLPSVLREEPLLLDLLQVEKQLEWILCSDQSENTTAKTTRLILDRPEIGLLLT